MIDSNFNLTLSKRQLPCLWESGGGYSNTGESRIICGKNGEKLKPIYVRNRGILSCKEHALIPVSEGYHIIEVDDCKNDMIIKVYRIETISLVNDTNTPHAYGKCIAEFSEGEWELEESIGFHDWFSNHMNLAVDAAVEKSRTYHCRQPMYIIEDVTNPSDKYKMRGCVDIG